MDIKKCIDNLNGTCRKALEKAADFCYSRSHFIVEPEHFFLKLLEISDTDLHRMLHCHGVNPIVVKRELAQAVDRLENGNYKTPSLSAHIQRLLQEAWILASLHCGEKEVRSAHLLAALLNHQALRSAVREIAPALLAIPPQSLKKSLRELSGEPEDRTASGREILREIPTEKEATPERTPGNFKTPALDQFTVDLPALVRGGLIDPVKGRDPEIGQIVDILSRRRQNNPILVGEAGVGKTAVVEGFALRIVSGDVPPSLRNISLRVLDLPLLLAGAAMKGEFENRLKSIITEVKESPRPVILFIDEAHTMIGAGGSAGQGDAANILKPALARGELRTIAATTWAEYKKYFEKDAALARRFQPIKVEEPGEEDAVAMLRYVTPSLEKHHNVRILDEALRDAVKLSLRYISGRKLPDKAIGVLDTACARVAAGRNGSPPALEEAARRVELLSLEIDILEHEENQGLDHSKILDNLRKELSPAKTLRLKLEKRWKQELKLAEKIMAIRTEMEKTSQAPGDRKKDFKPQAKELKKLERSLEKIQGEDPMVFVAVDSGVIASVISGWTGIPVGGMARDEIRTVLTLKEKMGERIKGQDHALEAITRVIRVSRAGLGHRGGPAGVFLLAGPTGVGKTETACALSDILYGGKMVVLNMSEYQEPYSVSGLKGSPPGYVGYGQGGTLTEAVRRNPYSLVLLDEVEKAHPDVLELFFQVFDKGVLEDADGLEVDFKNTLILLTSNAGENILSECDRDSGKAPEIEKLSESIRPELSKFFKPAFLGRLALVPYLPLGTGQMIEVARLCMSRVRDRLKENRGVELFFPDDAIVALAQVCVRQAAGARGIEHFLNRTVLPVLSEELLRRESEGTDCKTIRINLDEEGNFLYRCEPPSENGGEGLICKNPLAS